MVEPDVKVCCTAGNKKAHIFRYKDDKHCTASDKAVSLHCGCQAAEAIWQGYSNFTQNKVKHVSNCVIFIHTEHEPF